CPRCRKGDMFPTKNPWRLKTTMKMNDRCSVCRQPFNIEVGFYYGSGYVSYAFSIVLCVISFVAWWLLIGFSLSDNRFFYWIACNAVFLILMQPYLMRVARTGWLAFFVPYDKNWRMNPPKEAERTNTDQENNW
ncbi:MAG: DUF983 domain-containing protein, partial [Chitinophagaceae bacterium]